MVRKVIVSVLLAAVVSVPFVSPASAQTYGTQCTVAMDDVTVVAGQVVTVSGSVLGASEVLILIDGQPIATAPVTFTSTNDRDVDPTDEGVFSITITVPDLGPGEYTLTADCGGSIDEVLFQVVAQGGGGGGGGGGPGSLSDTGSDLDQLARAGGALLLLGGVLLLVATKRRRQDPTTA